MQARCVVQKHRAKTMYYDFRLEKDGVFKSWAMPKGMPDAMGLRRLAVQVPDYPLAWGSFEGTIPEGQYGAGNVDIWDEGTFEPLEWTDAAIGFVLHGRRLHEAHSLVRFRRKGPRDWLLFRRSRRRKFDRSRRHAARWMPGPAHTNHNSLRTITCD